MYYSNGNYEAFVHPQKPAGVEKKSAYLIGSGLAGLAAACFMIRDGQMDGSKIHFYEELPVSGGSMDGLFNAERGYIIRGGREMEEHFETLWDLFRSIPSLEHPEHSILDEYYWLNKKDPAFSYARLIEKKGQVVADTENLTLTKKAVKEVIKLALTPEKDLGDKKINEVFSKEFFKSNFWMYWATMFAFMPWASAMEMRRYLLRFVHHIDSLTNLKSLRFTEFNQYESLVLPMEKYLRDAGVDFVFNAKVTDITVEINGEEKVAKKLELEIAKEKQTIELTENDLVFVTNGSITESTAYGDNDHPAYTKKHQVGASWELWQKLADQSNDFGHPEKFYKNIPSQNWVMSATMTFSDERVNQYIQKINKKNPHSGSIVTSGPCTIVDSSWWYGYSISRQPHFKMQKSNELVVWTYALYDHNKGDYIKKRPSECTGIEMCEEFLYHIGVPEKEIGEIASAANTVPAYMPYVTTYFQPRALGDRPLVVPNGSKNLAFIGNYAETKRDTVFTTEYSVRTAMEAVYTLLEVDRGVPEVFASSFDARVLMDAMYYLNDRKKLSELDLNIAEKVVLKQVLKKVSGTYIEELLKDAKLM